MLDLRTYRILEKCFQTSAVLKHDSNIKQKLIKPEFQNYSTFNLYVLTVLQYLQYYIFLYCPTND